LHYLNLGNEEVNRMDPVDVFGRIPDLSIQERDLHVFPRMKMAPLDLSTDGVCDKIGFYARRPAGEDGSDPHPGYEETRLKDYLDQK